MSTTLKTAQEILASKNKRGIRQIPETVRAGIRMTKTQLRFCMCVCAVLVLGLIILSLIAGNQGANTVRVNEAAALLGINDAPFHQDQLFFRGCPMAGTKPGHIQGCVGQPGEAVDAGEIFGQLQLQTIGRSHHADIGTSGQTIFIRHAPVNLQRL